MSHVAMLCEHLLTKISAIKYHVSGEQKKYITLCW